MAETGFSRRKVLKAATAAAVAAPMINVGSYRLHAASTKTYSARAVG
ncbi:MAG: twin-arginine translocation signal domain-containing protein, partial [Oricola sp.]|nr:twin-arginine translocation signal domain-containing protein [Oricola sp.]